MHTIIGATLFHGPVRDGKGWVQSAIAAKRNHNLKEVNLNELNRILFKQPKNLSYNFNILA
tara:strand:- start:45 stop:227 length:183 start_codon:yes stop_codon:yes gene_type:complete